MDLESSSSGNLPVLETLVTDLLYETQHFDMHPRMFVDRVYNAFFETIHTSVNQMKDYMIREFNDVPSNVIKAQTDIFFRDVVEQLDKFIDRLELYLGKNVFSIGDHVVFPEDKIHIKEPCTKEDDEKLDAEIEELKQKILEEKAKKFFLKKTILEQNETIKLLSYQQNKVKAFVKTVHEMNVTPENIELLFTNLNKLCNVDVY